MSRFHVVGSIRSAIFAVAVSVFFLPGCSRKHPDQGPLSPEESLKSIHVNSDFHVELFASEPLVFDPPGVVRVSIPWISFEGLLNSAFEQIRLYAKGDVAVSLRLLRALTDVASTTQNVDYQRALVETGKRVVAGCTERLTENELKDLRLREKALESCVAISRQEVQQSGDVGKIAPQLSS